MTNLFSKNNPRFGLTYYFFQNFHGLQSYFYHEFTKGYKENKFKIENLNAENEELMRIFANRMYSAFNLFHSLAHNVFFDEYDEIFNWDSIIYLHYTNDNDFERIIKHELTHYNECMKKLQKYSNYFCTLYGFQRSDIFNIEFKPSKVSIEELEKSEFNTHCLKCDYKWFRRNIELPKVCPKCKRFDWQEERKNKK